jgi:hypothetical protein
MNIGVAQRCGQTDNHRPDIHVWVLLSSTREAKPLSDCSPLYSDIKTTIRLLSRFLLYQNHSQVALLFSLISKSLSDCSPLYSDIKTTIRLLSRFLLYQNHSQVALLFTLILKPLPGFCLLHSHVTLNPNVTVPLTSGKNWLISRPILKPEEGSRSYLQNLEFYQSFLLHYTTFKQKKMDRARCMQ